MLFVIKPAATLDLAIFPNIVESDKLFGYIVKKPESAQIDLFLSRPVYKAISGVQLSHPKKKNGKPGLQKGKKIEQ